MQEITENLHLRNMMVFIVRFYASCTSLQYIVSISESNTRRNTMIATACGIRRRLFSLEASGSDPPLLFTDYLKYLTADSNILIS